VSTDILPTAPPDQSAEHLDGAWSPSAAASAVHADEIVVLSASGTGAPVAWRERLVVSADRDGAAAAELPGTGTIVEAIVLSTCGRFDIYAVASDADRAERELLHWVARRSGSPVETVAGRVRTLRGRAAAHHVIATASGLRSPVLGEHEILGQVRRARDRATRSGAAGPILDRLVVEALRAGGRVRATTALGRGAVSVLSVGVQLVMASCPGTGRRALVLGRSRTAAAARDRLLAGGWVVTSAADLSSPSPLGTFLRAFDAVVTCTGTSATIVSADALADAAAGRGGTPLLVLDLSVPRDVDPRARLADGVLLYDVDALGTVAAPGVASRRAGISEAERIVDAELTHFEAWRANRMLAPTLKALRGHVRNLVVDALGEAAPSGPDAGTDARTVERLVGRLLHAPTRRLREAAADGSGAHRALLVQVLFGLDDDLAALRARGQWPFLAGDRQVLSTGGRSGLTVT
jgi:glutamyl-tRNA reductase